MTSSTHTENAVLELDNYLRENDYFADIEEPVVNQKILALRDEKFRTAIVSDIQSKYTDVEINCTSSVFELTSEDNQGVCLFFQKKSDH
jgi:hypothetical protein